MLSMGGEDWLLGLMEPRVVISLFRQRGGNNAQLDV